MLARNLLFTCFCDGVFFSSKILPQAEENTTANKRKISELEEGRADTEDRREKLGRLQENGQR